MTLPGVLLIVVGLQASAIVALLVERARRARAAQVLRASEERYRLIADHAPAMIWTARPDASHDYLSSTCMKFTGLRLEQLLEHGWLEWVHPDDRAPCIAIYEPALAARRQFAIEYRIRTADGSYRWLLDLGVPKYAADGTYTGYIGSCVDITERKQVEEWMRETQVALARANRDSLHLAGRFIGAQDAERARVARDLHDDVSQQLAGLSIALSSLKRRMDEAQVRDDLQADLRALHERAVTLAQDVRHLSHDLHPTVLRHAGLVAALDSHCAELERSHGIAVTCAADGDFSSLAPEAALTLYRITQEALRNVVAHAKASYAHVRLLHAGGTAEITITDDGKGFDVAKSAGGANGLGLVSITERARFAGGTSSIDSEPHQGTRVRARIPVGPAAADAVGNAKDGEREASRS